MSETTVDTAALSRVLAKPTIEKVHDVPVALLPPGFQHVDLESLLPAPRRIKRNVHAHDVDGFVSYVNAFKRSTTGIYAGRRDEPFLLAVIDDHVSGAGGKGETEEPSHTTHRCKFPCPHTVQWEAWTKSDGARHSQVEFAEHVERNIGDVVDPAGADLLSMTLDFQDTGRAEFSRAIRLHDGRVQFQYTEKDEGGDVKFPERMSLALPVFEGMPGVYPVKARIRYRIREGQLAIWYELDRPDLVLKQAYKDLHKHVSEAVKIPIHLAY